MDSEARNFRLNKQSCDHSHSWEIRIEDGNSPAASLSVIYLLEIDRLWMAFALLPHRRLPTVVIDHPLEGDSHIRLGVDGSSIDLVPRRIPKS